MSTAGGWDFYLGGAEGAGGYATGDVAETWNEYAAQSDVHLDDAADAIEASNEALYDAAGAIGTADFDTYAAQATTALDATYQNQLASLGLAPGVEYAGANDAEHGADPFDVSGYDSQVDGF